MPTAPLYDGPVVARRAPAARRPVASAAPTPTAPRRRLPALAALSHGSWQEYADAELGDLAEHAAVRARHQSAYAADVRDWGVSPGRESLFIAADESRRQLLIAVARRAAAALVESGWDPGEATRLALETAALVVAPTEARPAPAPRSLLGEIAELPGRTRPARVGRDAALDHAPAEPWRPATVRPAPAPERAPALTPREVSALRKKERAAQAPTPARTERAARRALREEELAEQARRDRDQRRRVSGK